jgi:hypothetical protein
MRRPDKERITDEDVTAVLLMPSGSDWDGVAKRLGVHRDTINKIRRRAGKRYLRLALACGVVTGLPLSRRKSEDDARAYVPNGRRAYP